MTCQMSKWLMINVFLCHNLPKGQGLTEMLALRIKDFIIYIFLYLGLRILHSICESRTKVMLFFVLVS